MLCPSWGESKAKKLAAVVELADAEDSEADVSPDIHDREFLRRRLRLPYFPTRGALMADYIYVDNSNVFIEGKRVSAVAKGIAMNVYDAMNNRILDYDYKMSFGRLHEFVAGQDESKIARAVLFGSRPPPNDSIWKYAERAGFELVLEDRNVENKEKKIDTGIVSAMVKDAYKKMNPASDVIVLVAGDSDFVPAVRDLVEDKFQVEVVFWDHVSKELRDICTRFISLNPHLDYLALK